MKPEPRVTFSVMFMDGADGAATQVWATENPEVYMIASRASWRELFKQSYLTVPKGADTLTILKLWRESHDDVQLPDDKRPLP